MNVFGGFFLLFFFCFMKRVVSPYISLSRAHEGRSFHTCLPHGWAQEGSKTLVWLKEWNDSFFVFRATCLVVITTSHSVQMLQCISLDFHSEYELFVSLHLTLFDHQAWCANQEKVSVFYSMWAGTLNTVSNCGTINMFCGLRWAYAHFAVASPPQY